MSWKRLQKIRKPLQKADFPVGNFEYFGTAHKVVLWRFSFDEKLRFEFLEICSDEWNLTASMEFREKMTAS